MAGASGQNEAMPDGVGVVILNDEHESVPAVQRLGVANGDIAKPSLIPIRPRQTRPGAFFEPQSKLGLRHGRAHRFVQIFHRLEEMRLADNDVGIRRKLRAERFRLGKKIASDQVSLAEGGEVRSTEISRQSLRASENPSLLKNATRSRSSQSTSVRNVEICRAPRLIRS